MDGCDQQAHQRLYLRLRTIPVFCRKRVHRQIFQTHGCSGFHDFTDRDNALLVSIAPVFSLRFGPTSVTVHNNRHMLRQSIFIYLFNQRHSVFIYNYCMLSIFFALLQVLHRGPKSQVTVNNKKEYQSLFFKKLPFIW